MFYLSVVLHKSGEDYLETIYILEERTGFVRSIDIAIEMGFSKPSVSKAMGLLRTRGYITIGDDGQIKLTKSGLKIAKEVFERHMTLRTFFIDILGVNEVTAEEDACLIEHSISEESYLRLKQFCQKHLEDVAKGKEQC